MVLVLWFEISLQGALSRRCAHPRWDTHLGHERVEQSAHWAAHVGLRRGFWRRIADSSVEPERGSPEMKW